MFDFIGDAICEFFASLVPRRVWFVLAVSVAAAVLLVILLRQPG